MLIGIEIGYDAHAGHSAGGMLCTVLGHPGPEGSTETSISSPGLTQMSVGLIHSGIGPDVVGRDGADSPDFVTPKYAFSIS